MKGGIRAVARDARGVELHTVYKDPQRHRALSLYCHSGREVRHRSPARRARVSSRTPLRDTWMSGHDGARGPLAPRDDATRARARRCPERSTARHVPRDSGGRGLHAIVVVIHGPGLGRQRWQRPQQRQRRQRAGGAARVGDDVPRMAGRWRARRDRIV